MSDMKSLGQKGAISALLISLILAVLLLFGALGFGFWAFSGRQDYKNNVDQKVATAVSAAQSQQQATDAKQYTEDAKNPLKKYVGPADYGSVTLQYPKTWSGYVVTANGSNPLDAYFQPDIVPNVTDPNNAFALRVQIISQPYDQVVQQFESQVQQKTATLSPYSLPKVPSVIGSRIDGTIATNMQGAVVILPLRNVTLQVSTQAQVYVNDFNNIILPNLSFTP